MNATIEVVAANDGHNVKCPRCWHWHGARENFGHLPEEVAAEPELASEKLCDGCQQLILDRFPDHRSVPHILAALNRQQEKYTVRLTAKIEASDEPIQQRMFAAPDPNFLEAMKRFKSPHWIIKTEGNEGNGEPKI